MEKEERGNASIVVGQKIIASSSELGLFFINRINNYALEENDTLLLINSNTFLAEYYWRKGAYEDAMKEVLESTRLIESNSDYQLELARCYQTLGTIHLYLNNSMEALDYYKKSAKIYVKKNQITSVVSVYNNMGVVYMDAAKLEEKPSYNDSALKYYNKVFENKEKSNIDNLLYSLGNAGSIYVEKGEYDKANELFKEWEELESKNPSNTQKAMIYGFIGELNRRKQNYPLAENYFLEGLKNAKAIDSKFEIQEYYLNLSMLYEQTGEFKKAYQMLINGKNLQDSLFNTEKNETIRELEKKYETEKKEQEITLLSQEKDLAETRQRLFIIATGLLVVITSLILFQYIQRNRHAKVVEEKNKQLSETMASKEKLFSVIAHDLKSPLSAFSAMSSTLADNIDVLQKEQIVTYLRKVEKGSQNLSELLNNLLEWSLSQTGSLPVNIEKLDIRAAMENAVKPLRDLAESKEIVLSLEAEPLAVAGDSKMVETVIRNLVSNALKFTDHGGKVSLTTRQEDGQVRIAVLDTGIGMDKDEVAKLFDITEDPMKIGEHEEKGTGLGLILSKELIEKNQGTIGAFSEVGKGSTFYFTLPSAA